MKYKFYGEGPLESVEYVKSILPLLGNITMFEVYGNKEASPYFVIDSGEELRYTFILRDDKENEIWLYTLCGYHGSGSDATQKILQLCGIKKDFKIFEEGNNHIKKCHLKPTHKLNLLVEQDISISYDEDKTEYNFIVSIDFKYAYQKQNLLNMLQLIGYLHHVIPNNIPIYKQAYLFDEFDVPEYEYYDYTNYIVNLNKKLKGFTQEQVEILIKELIKNTGGNII